MSERVVPVSVDAIKLAIELLEYAEDIPQVHGKASNLSVHFEQIISAAPAPSGVSEHERHGQCGCYCPDCFDGNHADCIWPFCTHKAGRPAERETETAARQVASGQTTPSASGPVDAAAPDAGGQEGTEGTANSCGRSGQPVPPAPTTPPPQPAASDDYGAKHIARLEKRAAALEARMAASPMQTDFQDEAAELKSIRWSIKEIRAIAALRQENSGLRSAWQQLRAEHEATLRQLIAAEDAVAQARDRALEEASKVCERRIGNGDYSMDSRQAAWDSEAQGCANFIRALIPADIKREGA